MLENLKRYTLETRSPLFGPVFPLVVFQARGGHFLPIPCWPLQFWAEIPCLVTNRVLSSGKQGNLPPNRGFGIASRGGLKQGPAGVLLQSGVNPLFAFHNPCLAPRSSHTEMT